jgi:hypothetical protein
MASNNDSEENPPSKKVKTATQLHPLQRDPTAGMNPVTLLTGYYGPRGERIRHQVHEGALRLPKSALEMYQSTNSCNKDGQGSAYVLPELDSVLRPSLDPNISPLVVTEVRNEDIVQEDVSPEDGTIHTTTFTKTIINNRTVARPVKDMERIRGGGGGDNDEDSSNAVKPTVDSIDPSPLLQLPVSLPENITQNASISIQHSVATLDSTSKSMSRESNPVPMDIDPPNMVPVPVPVVPPSVSSATSTLPITASAPIDAASIIQMTSGVNRDNNNVGVDYTRLVHAESISSDPQTAAAAPPPPIRTASADPTLKQQDISYMEKTLLSNLQSDVPISIPDTGSSGRGEIQSAPMTIDMVPTAATVQQTSTIYAPEKVQVPVPLTTSSSISVNAPEPQVIPLAKRPLEQYESHKIVNNSAPKKNHPDWYKTDMVSSLERGVLSEWFDGSAKHRTEQSYLEIREKIIEMSITMGSDHFLTGTMIRRTIPGDAGSLLRLHAFLTSYGFVNQNSINESTPTPMVLIKRPKVNHKADWENNEIMKVKLMHAVVEQTRRLQEPSYKDTNDVIIDWDDVALSVGNNVTASECERQFLTMSIVPQETKQDESVTPDGLSVAADDIQHSDNNIGSFHSKVKQELLSDIVNSVDSAVIHSVLNAALSSVSNTTSSNSNNLQHAQNASLFGLMVHNVAEGVQLKEQQILTIMSEMIDLRMKKLESRLQLLDDVEDMLEAERVALELERRDLYTARCRHWFGGT